MLKELSMDTKIFTIFRIMMTASLMLFVTACAQLPQSVEDHQSPKNGTAINTSKADQSTSSENSIVIYVYPKKGKVSQGQYFSLPLIHSNLH